MAAYLNCHLKQITKIGQIYQGIGKKSFNIGQNLKLLDKNSVKIGQKFAKIGQSLKYNWTIFFARVG